MPNQAQNPNDKKIYDLEERTAKFGENVSEKCRKLWKEAHEFEIYNMMLKNFKHKLIILSITALIIAGIVNYVYYLINKPLKILNSYTIPTEFIYNGAKITLAWTDDNTGENLIIQSDKKEYSGFNTVDVYFSITNISNKDQGADIVIWLEEGKRSVEKIEKIGSQRTQREGGSLSGAYAIQPLALNSAESSAYAPLRPDGLRVASAGTQANDKIDSGETNYYKATIKYPTLSKGEFFIEAFSAQGGYGHLDPWYSSSWTYKRAITLQGSKIATTTANFPILATTTLADLKTTTNGGKVGNDSGYDIIFVDSDDSTLLNYEREKYASTTGEIAYWIKTDIASSTDKTIYMYYGNAGASDTATTTGVWDSSFKMVQHLKETDIDGGAGDIKDSTLYANNGTTYAMNTSDQVAGQIDGSLDFDGVDDYVDAGDAAILDGATSFSISFWYFLNSSSVTPLQKWGADASYIVTSYSTNHPYIGVEDGAGLGSYYAASTYTWETGKWVYFVCTWKGGFPFTTNHIYINAVNQNLTAVWEAGPTYVVNTATHLKIGNVTNGILDEVRVSNTARTAGWITTEYNNQSSVGTFLTIGTEVCMPVPAERSGAGENVKTRIKGGVRFKGGSRF